MSVMHTERALSWHIRNGFMLTNLACPISRLRGEWEYTTVQRLHHRQTRSHGTEGWKYASENNEWMIVQRATFSTSLNSRNIDKAFRISGSVSGSHLKAVFWYPYPVANSLSCRISNRQTGYWSSLIDTNTSTTFTLLLVIQTQR